MEDYTEGLRRLNRSGSDKVCRHAGILRSKLKTEAGKASMTAAETSLQVKLAQQRASTAALTFQKSLEASFCSFLAKGDIADGESVHVGQKHPRDCSDDDNAVQTKPPWNRECSEYKERENTWSGDSEALLPDGRPSVQPASFDQAEDAESSNRVIPSDLPVQPALFNQATPSRTSLKVTLAEDPNGQHASGVSAGMNHKQLRRISFGRTLRIDDCLDESTSRIYTWDYLKGNGRRDSNVSTAWRHNGVDISNDLMEFRDRVVQENGGLNHPHQKLAVNFVFLLEGDHRTKGLHMEIDDKPWTALCDATRDHADRLPEETVTETLQWVQFLMRESPDVLKSRLGSTPPKDPSLKSILNLMAVSGHLWDSEPGNEDSLLKAWLGPFLSTYFGQEMKLALNSILMLSPADDVCVVGILVTEPLVEFFSMKIHSEGCYVMHRFAICYVPTDHENMISLISMMEAFHHAAAKVIKTLAAIRQVRVRPSPTPKVPFSWLRQSFSKPTKTLVRDGQ
ncbi:hypothetical protein BGX34_009152 [Mortierella sp. NVP85]|nr:hypothetical protein BGX34_009152 [Mortierella sp. NVP85]